MTEDLLKATHSGKLEIGNVSIPCFVLENGTRVISGRSLTASIGMKGRGQGAARIPTHKSLKTNINNQLAMAIKNPLKFKGIGGRTTSGYEATVLQELCDAILTARDEGELKTEQDFRYAKQADILIRSFAKVGIIALVDEATGYQEVRDRLALQKILDKYITDEWAKWTKTFPDDYYRELFRLKNTPYPPVSMKRPQYVGHWTNDIVYSRLAPGVLSELKIKNPRSPAGHRKRRFHQYLTRDIGHPTLKEHLSNVVFLMKGCTKWDDFKRRLNRSAPKYGDTIPIDFPEE